MPTNVVRLCLLSLLWIASAAQGQTRYVSDQLIVPLRTGPSIRNAITRNLPAGTAVEVLEQDEESGYSRVRLQGRDIEGWMESQYLTDEPIARDRLEAAERQLATAQGRVQQLEAELEVVRAELDTARTELEQAQAASGELARELQDVRQASANVLAIREEKEQLAQRLEERDLQVQSLTLANSALRQRERQSWFIIGAAVLFTGIVIGLVLPRLRRRRRSDW
ncbi:MAG TPA: TIGR04211 family SH3 domain-containing protein [Gammaproteobacteria bacterium]